MKNKIALALTLSATAFTFSVQSDKVSGIQPYQLDAAIENCIYEYSEVSGNTFFNDNHRIDTAYIIVAERDDYVVYFTRGGFGHFGEPHPKNYKIYIRCYGSIQENRVFAIYSYIDRLWLVDSDLISDNYFSRELTESWYRRKEDGFSFVASQDYEAGEYDRMLTRKHEARLEECETQGKICGI